MGVKKVHKTLLSKLILGFIGGAMISLGYLAYLRIAAVFSGAWEGIGHLIGSAIFPIGLIIILLAGGELVTGNMMVVSSSLFERKITLKDWILNLTTITLANALGALFVALFFGHLLGLTSQGIYLEKLLSLCHHKLDATFLQCFLSGIGCNWFVGLSLWLSYGAKSGGAKILAIWFPVMSFVVIGFQHCVANIFLVSAAIMEGHYSWLAFIQNFLPVFLGNIVGGSVFVAAFYYLSYSPKE